MIYSGLDQSGDVGDPARGNQGPRFVTVLAHVGECELPCLASVLASIKRERHLPDRFVFRYSDCSNGVRLAFFTNIARVRVCAHAIVADKRDWPREAFAGRGYHTTDKYIVDVICGCPREIIVGQTIRLDQPRNEKGAVERTISTVKLALKGCGYRPYPKITPTPDHRLDGLIVQVADMIAGALNDAGGVEGLYLQPLHSRIILL